MTARNACNIALAFLDHCFFSFEVLFIAKRAALFPKMNNLINRFGALSEI